MSEGIPGGVWVTGAGGLIGHACVGFADRFGGRARPLMRGEVDLADFRAVERLFVRERPTGVIHCAARSRSPACQADPAGARIQNVEVTRRLAELAAEIPMVFLSTDLVFDGRRNGSEGGYHEDDAVNPLSVYAETKVEAESWVRRNPRHAIVRTSLNFGRSPSGPGAFNEELAAAWRAGRVVDLFVDEFRCPIAAVETARRLWALLDSGQGGRVSPRRFGALVAVRDRAACGRRSPAFGPRFGDADAGGFVGGLFRGTPCTRYDPGLLEVGSPPGRTHARFHRLAARWG